MEQQDLSSEIIDALSKLNAERIYDKSTTMFNNYFIQPESYHLFFNDDPVLLEGSRGTGKSMLLINFYEENKLNLHNGNSELIKFPFIVRIKDNDFIRLKHSEFLDKLSFEEVLTEYFMSKVVAQFCEELLLRFPDDPNSLDLSGLSEVFHNTRFPSKQLSSAISSLEKIKTLFSRNYIRIQSDLRNHIRPRINITSQQFLFDFFETLPTWGISKERTILPFILLDEYDRLNPQQQIVINSFLKERSNHLIFKVGCKSGYFTRSLSTGESIEQHDIEIKNINLFLKENYSTKLLSDYLQNVILKRISSLIPNFSLDDFLGKSYNLSEKDEALSKRTLRFFGMNDIALISAGSIREYIKLCRDLILHGINLGFITSTGIQAPLPEGEQNDIIKSFSSQKYNDIANIEKYGDLYLHFIEYIRQKIRLRIKSNMKYKHTIDIGIRDFSILSSQSRDFIESAVRNSVLLYHYKKPKDDSYNTRVYSLNASLAPHLGILISRSDFISITKDEFDNFILNPSDKINELNKEVEITQRSLEDFEQ